MHTPGPWTVKADQMNTYIVADVQQTGGVTHWSAIASMDEDDQQGQADAKLIAAAPDLLAALRRTQALLFLRTDASDEESMAALRDALDAIAKAQG
jgi:NAD-dependent oxidoreductase involved in siderophore biosynthesis